LCRFILVDEKKKHTRTESSIDQVPQVLRYGLGGRTVAIDSVGVWPLVDRLARWCETLFRSETHNRLPSRPSGGCHVAARVLFAPGRV
jgi:hypothetical protein